MASKKRGDYTISDILRLRPAWFMEKFSDTAGIQSTLNYIHTLISGGLTAITDVPLIVLFPNWQVPLGEDNFWQVNKAIAEFTQKRGDEIRDIVGIIGKEFFADVQDKSELATELAVNVKGIEREVQTTTVRISSLTTDIDRWVDEIADLHDSIRGRRRSIEESEQILDALTRKLEEIKSSSDIGRDPVFDDVFAQIPDGWVPFYVKDRVVYILRLTPVTMSNTGSIASGVSATINTGYVMARVYVNHRGMYLENAYFVSDYIKTRHPHAHVSNSGSICWGNMSSHISKAHETRNLRNAFELLEAVLSTYCGDNPYVTFAELAKSQNKREFLNYSCMNGLKAKEALIKVLAVAYAMNEPTIDGLHEKLRELKSRVQTLVSDYAGINQKFYESSKIKNVLDVLKMGDEFSSISNLGNPYSFKHKVICDFMGMHENIPNPEAYDYIEVAGVTLRVLNPSKVLKTEELEAIKSLTFKDFALFQDGYHGHTRINIRELVGLWSSIVKPPLPVMYEDRYARAQYMTGSAFWFYRACDDIPFITKLSQDSGKRQLTDEEKDKLFYYIHCNKDQMGASRTEFDEWIETGKQFGINVVTVSNEMLAVTELFITFDENGVYALYYYNPNHVTVDTLEYMVTTDYKSQITRLKDIIIQGRDVGEGSGIPVDLEGFMNDFLEALVILRYRRSIGYLSAYSSSCSSVLRDILQSIAVDMGIIQHANEVSETNIPTIALKIISNYIGGDDDDSFDSFIHDKVLPIVEKRFGVKFYASDDAESSEEYTEEEKPKATKKPLDAALEGWLYGCPPPPFNPLSATEANDESVDVEEFYDEPDDFLDDEDEYNADETCTECEYHIDECVCNEEYEE